MTPVASTVLRTFYAATGSMLNILIDEMVAYARKIYGVTGLPSGTFEAVQTFI